ncbi:MAG: flagellar assembly protein FliW [Campylobacterota bacterium]|nr:flagellar assembly protein FliW [Campylobacterota bacterium]
MIYNVAGEIYGFDKTFDVELNEIDELFATIKDIKNKNISFTLVNPYLLREYSFDLPSNIKILLDINEKSNLLVYNIVVVQDPLDESKINFLAPLIFNKDNNKMAQVILKPEMHADFGMAESIKSFK